MDNGDAACWRARSRLPASAIAYGVAALFVGGLLGGCGSIGGSIGSATSSMGDRFSELFGSRSRDVGTTAAQQQAEDPDCPGVDIRSGASTLAVSANARGGTPGDLRYQGTITRTARECILVNGNVQAKLGIQGRIIVGPAGAPTNVDIPLRIAVVQEGAQPKTVFSKFYRTSVAMTPGENGTNFTFVAEDIAYPVPAASVSEAYVFYVGFDPEGIKGAPKPKASKKR